MMHEIAAFFAQCAQSGMLLASLCALVVVPLAAWSACRLLAVGIHRMGDDSVWQAPLAALAAGLPGALFLSVAAMALFGGVGAACLTLTVGRVIVGLIAGVAAVALIRAVWLAVTRSRRMQQLIASSSPPSARLARVAHSCGIVARELEDDIPTCALAGIAWPIAIVSSGALRLFSDEQLGAALHHERAHAMRGDQIIAAALHFFVDLLPLPAADLVKTYKSAREFAADRIAAAATDVDALAGALLGFAKRGVLLAVVPSLTGSERAGIAERLRALFDQPKYTRTRDGLRIVRRWALATALLLVALTGITVPAMASHPHGPVCTAPMSATP